MKRLIVICLLLLAPGALAQEDTRLTIAMLRYGGPAGEPNYVETRVISMLENYGYISEGEAEILQERRDLEGETVNLYWGDADWDFATASLLVEEALDREADVIVTVATPMLRAAVNVTLDMGDPPVVLGSSMLYPYAAGIAEAPCIKPAHVIGAVVEVPVERLFALMLTQQPEIERIGIWASASETSGSEGAAAMSELAEVHGLSAKVSTMVSQSDALATIDALMGSDIEAVITAWDILVSHNLPHLTEAARDAGIPVYVPVLPAVWVGAAYSAGTMDDSVEAQSVARLLASVLAGELEPATTGLLEVRHVGIGVNLDALAELGMTAPPSILDEADLIVNADEPKLSDRYFNALVLGSTKFALEQDSELDAALVASLHCSDEMIAEQQAELDAAGR